MGVPPRLREICLALPEAAEVGFGGHENSPTFRVRNKIFAMYANGQDDATGPAAWLKAAPGVQAELLAVDPERFFAPPYVGPKGWVGIRLDGPCVDWTEVAELMLDSYRLIAPKRLIAQLDT